PLHSLVRWVFILMLAASLCRNFQIRYGSAWYSRGDEVLRSSVSGLSHLQLVLGFILYFKSPLTAFFRTHTRQALAYREMTFFGIFHITLMTIAIVLVSIGA